MNDGFLKPAWWPAEIPYRPISGGEGGGDGGADSDKGDFGSDFDTGEGSAASTASSEFGGAFGGTGDPSGGSSEGLDTGEGTGQNTASSEFSDTMGSNKDASAQADREGASRSTSSKSLRDNQWGGTIAAQAVETGERIGRAGGELISAVTGIPGLGTAGAAAGRGVGAALTGANLSDSDTEVGSSLLDTEREGDSRGFGPGETTGPVSGNYDNPEGGREGIPGMIGVPVPDGAGGEGGGEGGGGGDAGGLPPLPDLPEPPDIGIPNAPPDFPNPNNVNNGGPAMDETAEIIRKAKEFGRQSTLITGGVENPLVAAPGLGGGTSARTVGTSQSNAASREGTRTGSLTGVVTISNEFDKLDRQRTQDGTGQELPTPSPDAQPLPPGWRVERSYGTLPYEIVVDPSGKQWIRSTVTGELVENLAVGEL